MEKQSPHEIKELIDAIMALSCKIALHLKDGFQWSDLPALLRDWYDDEEFSNLIKKGFLGMNKIPDEMKEISLVDGFDIAAQIIPWIQKLLVELKK